VIEAAAPPSNFKEAQMVGHKIKWRKGHYIKGGKPWTGRHKETTRAQNRRERRHKLDNA
jgi:hypothetical protein